MDCSCHDGWDKLMVGIGFFAISELLGLPVEGCVIVCLAVLDGGCLWLVCRCALGVATLEVAVGVECVEPLFLCLGAPGWGRGWW